MSPIALGVMLGCALVLGGGIGWLICAAAHRTDWEIDDLGRQRLGTPARELRFAAGPECDRPPEGWQCTRGRDHEGPCAAVKRKAGGGWSGTGDVR